MAKENKEVTERMREDIEGELVDVSQTKADINYYAITLLSAFNAGRKISIERVDTEEAKQRISELLDDLFHPVTKELNNRLEDL